MTNTTREEFTKRIDKLDVKNLIGQIKLLEVSKELLDDLIVKYMENNQDGMVEDAEHMIANLYESHFICVGKLKERFGIEYNSAL